MADSSDRRISLDPFFESFDFLDAEPASQPHGTNGYHVASSYDEEMILFGGLDSQSIEPAAVTGSNGTEASVESNGAEPHAESNGNLLNGTASNGTASNRTASNGTASNGTTSDGTDVTASNGTASNGIVSGDIASNGTASNGDLFVPDSAHESAAALPDISETETTEPPDSEADFEVIDLGHDPQVAAELPLLEELPVSDEPVAAEDATVTDTLDSPAAELVDSLPELPEAVASPSAASTPSARDTHPATGSMFVPYLVTEIRELRGRNSRRRSWWRRLFG